MLSDFLVPAPLTPPRVESVPLSAASYRSALWEPASLAEIMTRLAGRGREALAELGRERIFAAWRDTVAEIRFPDSAIRQALADPLRRLTRLSPEGLEAGLEAVLGGVSGEPAARLFAEGEARRRLLGSPPGPALIVLASNLPALAVQSLLPALALGRPVLIKSPSAEPLFAPAFVAALGEREPAILDAVAAMTWKGGLKELEGPLLAAAGRVIAYGEERAIADLERRAPGKIFAYGPKTSLALVSADADPAETARALARDIALFDQRGCLSVGAVFTSGSANALGEALSRALADYAEIWPPGPPTAPEIAGLRLARAESEMRSLTRWEAAVAEGTVIIEPRGTFEPSPGLRTARIHPLPRLGRARAILEPWKNRLQGAALAGEEAWKARPWLADLGVSRFAEPGELQSPDAGWHNGGVPPLEALGS